MTGHYHAGRSCATLRRPLVTSGGGQANNGGAPRYGYGVLVVLIASILLGAAAFLSFAFLDNSRESYAAGIVSVVGAIGGPLATIVGAYFGIQITTASSAQAQQTVQQATTTAQETVQQANTAAKETFQQAATTAQETVQQANTAAKETVQQAATTAQETVQQANTAAKETVQQAAAAAQQTVQETAQSMQAAQESNLQADERARASMAALNEVAGQIPPDLWNTLKDLPSVRRALGDEL